MAIPILREKLHRPPAPAGMIAREGLFKACGGAGLILVSAQAGAGKSTAVSAWAAGQDRTCCWYSLDDWDNDPLQFFTYLAEGLKAVDESAARTLAQLLDAWQTVGCEAFTRALVHQLHTIGTPFILVLDDYHLIINEQIHRALRTLLEHFPPGMLLVLITREDPPFPLAKWRTEGKLLEIRVSDLRFTAEEAAAYFARHLPVPLEEAQLRRLIGRTEGWAAGLQMAALSLQDLDDPDGFIAAFSGSHYYIMDYLMEEVLERHPPDIRAFLLGTSILDSFSGPLCDALLQLPPGTGDAIIDRLVRTNSFIIPMDPARQWYRYHHLFRDLLAGRLAGQAPGDLAALHHRAGRWYQAKGRGQEAIHHLLLAEAPGEAAALIERSWAEMDLRLQSAAWLEMAKKLPRDILESSPVLMMGYGWALLDLGEAEGCREWFEKALALHRQALESGPSQGLIISDKVQFDLLPATVASAYAYIAAAKGDAGETFRQAEAALSGLPEDQFFKRSMVETLLGLAHWERGDLHEAGQVILGAIQGVRRAGKPFPENSYWMLLGELYLQQGDLAKAKTLFEQTIARLIRDKTDAILLPALYLGLAKAAYLQGNIAQAEALLMQSKARGQQYALMDWQYKYFLLQARICCSQGRYDEARDCIRESRAHYYFNPIPEDLSIDAVEGQIEEAAARQPLKAKEKDGPAALRERANRALAEPLTARELDVLSLIVSGSSNGEICSRLFLALSTVKGYNQNIYMKLGVSRRTQAILKAKELGLA
ncbi:MAG: LuxR C-terminal-related transcriptional regulator [Christensenellales bacterium]